MKLHEQPGQSGHRFIEFWDVSGSKQYEDCRSMFYTNNIHGVILVYALNNQKSFTNLKKWGNEINSALKAINGGDSHRGNAPSSSHSLLRHRQADASTPSQGRSYSSYKLPVPTLIVGNKSDLKISAKCKSGDDVVHTSAEKCDVDQGRFETFFNQVFSNANSSNDHSYR